MYTNAALAFEIHFYLLVLYYLILGAFF